ncbi:MAG: serine/threonine protein kinase [Opitutae bacterium]|nr:serine/threonine protein kinase [Opitutae bacterium]
MTREEQLFNEALALPPADRAAFVARACAGDEPLHRRLAELLDAYASSDDFLAAPALLPPPGLIEEKPGDVLGRYTLVSKLGEGGCGSVYLAEQHEPVRRHVALKVIKLGMDTREVIARFEAERQALALMDHPNIARVFDAGATAAGRPYFVMEFVDGVPITQFCDTQQLAVPERLDLFARLCLALQHAHQKGIIHRDLKPSNILVTLVDGVPTPKIIDFGIAKATQGKLTAHTLVTRFEQMIGTPVYMSPEQADLRDTDIDTRSDIYSLGVLLYELLAGRPPFDPQSLLQAGVAEVRRIIRETDPPRPSAAVSTLADADRTTVAQRRRASPARLPSALRGDLDWIVMRCLEKQRDRRYGTAEELGRDIRRHLSREPVTARPPSALYRTRKFISRHRLACASAAALTVALLAGATVSTWQAIRATRAEHEARLAQSDAQRRQEQAEAILGFMLGDFRAELKKLGRLSLLDGVGDKAMAHFAALTPGDQTDNALLQHATALSQIGEIRLDQARFADAEAAFVAAHDRASTLATRRPGNGDMIFARSQVEYWLGVTRRKKGDLPGASRWLTAYRDSALRLVALDPTRSAWQIELGFGHHSLAVLEMDRGNYAAARAGFLAELAILERESAAKPGGGDTALRYNIADVHSWLGSAAERSGDFGEARARYEDQVRRIEELLQAEPDNVRWSVRLADALGFKAELALHTQRVTDSQASNRRAFALIAAQCAKDPANRTWQRIALAIRLREVALLRARGEVEGASVAANSARNALEKLVLLEPSSREFAVLLLRARHWDAELGAALGQRDAGATMGKAIELGEWLIGLELVNGTGFGEFLTTCQAAASLSEQAGDTAQATALRQRAVAVAAPYLDQSRDWRLLDPAARALSGLGRNEEARALVARLSRSGYVPPSPWPAALLP